MAIIAFEIFDELIESPAPLLGDSVKSIVQFSLDVCSSQNLESNTRHQVRKEMKYNFSCISIVLANPNYLGYHFIELVRCTFSICSWILNILFHPFVLKYIRLFRSFHG